MAHDLAGSSIGASRSALSPPDARVHLFHRSVSISNRIHFGSRLQRKSGKQHLMAGTKDVWAGSRIHSEASVNVASTQLFHGRFFPWYACGTFISSGYGTLDSWVLFLCYRNFSREIADIHGISIFVIGYTGHSSLICFLSKSIEHIDTHAGEDNVVGQMPPRLLCTLGDGAPRTLASQGAGAPGRAGGRARTTTGTNVSFVPPVDSFNRFFELWEWAKSDPALAFRARRFAYLLRHFGGLLEKHLFLGRTLLLRLQGYQTCAGAAFRIHW